MLDMKIVLQTLENSGQKIRSLAHLGANHAQGRSEYIQNGIQKLLWVEALPDLVDDLRHRLSSTGDVILQGVLSNISDENVTFNVASNNGMSSSIFEFKDHVEKYPSIKMVKSVDLKTVTLDDLMKRHSLEFDYDMAVLDLQGAELKALQGARCLLDRVSAIACEVSCIELYKNAPLETDIDNFMSKNSFTKLMSAYTEYGWGETLYIKKRAA